MHDADKDAKITKDLNTLDDPSQAANAAHASARPDPVESHRTIGAHNDAAPQGHDSGASAMQLNAAPMNCTVYSTLQKPLMPKIQAASAAHLDFCASAMQLKAASMSYSEYSTPQKPMMPPTSAHNSAHNDSGASAMQLNAAPMSCSEYSTPQKPLMPPTSAHNNAHNNADLRARFNAGHFRLQTRNAC